MMYQGSHEKEKILKNGNRKITSFHMFEDCDSLDVAYEYNAFYKKIVILDKDFNIISSDISPYTVSDEGKKLMEEANANIKRVEKEHYEKTGERIYIT